MLQRPRFQFGHIPQLVAQRVGDDSGGTAGRLFGRREQSGLLLHHGRPQKTSILVQRHLDMRLLFDMVDGCQRPALKLGLTKAGVVSLI